MSYPQEGFCPEILKYLDAEYHNGFGFQCGNTDEYPGRVIFGKIDFEFINETSIQKIAKSCRIINWLGVNFILVHFSEWNQIPKIVNHLITDQKIKVITHNKIGVVFENGDEFTWENMERKFIKQFIHWADDYPPHKNSEDSWKYIVNHFFHSKHVLKSHWNFCTPEGKSFCTELRSRMNCKTPYSKRYDQKNVRFMWNDFECYKLYEKYKIYFRGSWSYYEPSLLDINMPIFSDQEDVLQCIICMDKTANTQVDPCGHVVCCKDCSDKLVDTSDAKICVKCRCPITNIVKVF